MTDRWSRFFSFCGGFVTWVVVPGYAITCFILPPEIMDSMAQTRENIKKAEEIVLRIEKHCLVPKMTAEIGAGCNLDLRLLQENVARFDRVANGARANIHLCHLQGQLDTVQVWGLSLWLESKIDYH